MNLRVSTVDAVANQLRQELLSGAIHPGTRILPNDLAKRFSVSHIPVREALRRLEAEGLVFTSPQRATFAAEIGLDDLEGLYELRRVVEGEFAWRSAQARGDDDIERVRAAYADLSSAEPYSESFFAAHRAFHWTLLQPASSEVTRQVLERLWLEVDRYVALAALRLASFSNKQHVNQTMREHRGLRDAYTGGHANELRELLVTHLTNTEKRLRDGYREVLSGSESLSRWLQAAG